jgi:hypothetical protein
VDAKNIATNRTTMKPKHTILFLTLTTLSLTACHKDDIRSSGLITAEARTVPAFTDVRIDGPIEADIRYGASQYVEVRTDINAISRVRTNVSGSTLIISLDEANYHDGLKFHVTVDMPTIGRLTQNGVSDVEVSGFFGLASMEVISNGVGDLTLHGSTDRLSITQHGVGRVNASGMQADTCQVGLSGVGNMEVRVSDRLFGYLSGVGSIHYHGEPVVEVNDTGVGNVIRVD